MEFEFHSITLSKVKVIVVFFGLFIISHASIKPIDQSWLIFA